MDTLRARAEDTPTPSHPGPGGSRRPPSRRTLRRRRAAVLAAVIAVGVGAVVVLWPEASTPPPPAEIRGTSAWALEHYGNPDAKGFEGRVIVEVDFLGRTMFVHRAASRHFLRLERLFEARAPEYAATIALGELDDWSYENRVVSGTGSKSNHAFGLAVDVNALTNVLGTTGDMPEDVVRQWEAEGGEWGGDWSRPDPMHFETHLTPQEIKRRYRADGTPRDWYLEQLVAG